MISIVLPVYNGSRFLKESVDSIIAQSYSDWELILVNDCSTDNTLDICKDYSMKDSRISVYTNQKNMRQTWSMNFGFSKAKGDYLTWTSDDNRYKPTALEEMISYLENHQDCDFVYCDYDTIDENGKVTGTCTVDEPVMNLDHCSVGACFLYKKLVREIVGDYDVESHYAQDYDYWIRVYDKMTMHTLHKCLYEYRYHDGMCSTTGGMQLPYAEAFVKAKNADIIVNGLPSRDSAVDFFEKVTHYRFNLSKQNVDVLQKKYDVPVKQIKKKIYTQLRDDSFYNTKQKIKKILGLFIPKKLFEKMLEIKRRNKNDEK